MKFLILLAALAIQGCAAFDAAYYYAHCGVKTINCTPQKEKP